MTTEELNKLPVQGEQSLATIAKELGIDVSPNARDADQPNLIKSIQEAVEKREKNAEDLANGKTAPVLHKKAPGKDKTVTEKLNDTITVKATANVKPGENGSFKAVFFEKDEQHPDGQAWIADDQTHEVFPTSKVLLAIKQEVLTEV